MRTDHSLSSTNQIAVLPQCEYDVSISEPVKEPEMSPAMIPKYADICQSLVKQYWRNDANLEPITELQVLIYNVIILIIICLN